MPVRLSPKPPAARSHRPQMLTNRSSRRKITPASRQRHPNTIRNPLPIRQARRLLNRKPQKALDTPLHLPKHQRLPRRDRDTRRAPSSNSIVGRTRPTAMRRLTDIRAPATAASPNRLRPEVRVQCAIAVPLIHASDCERSTPELGCRCREGPSPTAGAECPSCGLDPLQMSSVLVH
jgi:hypothetical protein